MVSLVNHNIELHIGTDGNSQIKQVLNKIYRTIQILK